MIQEAVDGQAASAMLSLIIVVNTVARTRGRQPSRSPGHRLGLDAKRPLPLDVQHHTKLGAQVRRSVAAGELVGDDLVEKVVHRRLSEHDWNFGFIVDGFPRNQPQARFFLESYDLDAVILLEVPDELVKERILSRRLCSRCGLDYNLISSRPAVAGTCDVCGGWLVARADDTPEAVQGRLRD